MSLPRRSEVPSHATGWAPATEGLHKLAKRKLAETRELQRVSADELADPRASMSPPAFRVT